MTRVQQETEALAAFLSVRALARAEEADNLAAQLQAALARVDEAEKALEDCRASKTRGAVQ